MAWKGFFCRGLEQAVNILGGGLDALKSLSVIYFCCFLLNELDSGYSFMEMPFKIIDERCPTQEISAVLSLNRQLSHLIIEYQECGIHVIGCVREEVVAGFRIQLVLLYDLLSVCEEEKCME
jgi:hypothetical protein